MTAAGQYARGWQGSTLSERFKALAGDLNVCSKKGLSERFDSTIGAATVLMPFGGRTQLTPAQAMVAKLPVDGETTTCSGMAWGFNPYLMEQDPYRGAYLSVVESVSRLVATGFDHQAAYLTFQEYFERLGAEPTRWASRWPPCWARWMPRWIWVSRPSAARTACPAALKSWTCPPRW